MGSMATDISGTAQAIAGARYLPLMQRCAPSERVEGRHPDFAKDERNRARAPDKGRRIARERA
jgi:hypothetical protein